MSTLIRGRWLAGSILLAGAAGDLPAADAEPNRTLPLGEQIFRHNFARPAAWSGPVLGDGGDGLGPQYNDTSCVACHQQGGIGGAGDNHHNALVLSFRVDPRLSRSDLEDVVRTAGRVHPQLTATSTSTPLHRYGLPLAPEGRPYEEFLAGVFDRVNHKVQHVEPARGVVDQATLEVCQRNTIALWGAGEIDEFRRRDGDGIRRRLMEEQNRRYDWLSGRVPRDTQQREAWFGWRGQSVSLHEFNLGACATELGLTVPGIAQHDSPLVEGAPPEARLDLTAAQCLDLTAFVAELPRPQQLLPTETSALTRVQMGEQVFQACRCDACHCRDLGWLTGLYSDMLLHDMGPGLCDEMEAMFELLPGEVIPGVIAGGSGYYSGPPTNVFMPPKVKPTNCECEWKTPPLWGCADSAPYLHDGRAATLEAAILWHGGEADTSRTRYKQLPPSEVSVLMEFLSTLRAPGAAAPPTQLAAVEPVSHPANPAPATTTELVVAELAEPDGPVGDDDLPMRDAIPVAQGVHDQLTKLLQTLPAKSPNLATARELANQLPVDLPEPGLADYALALFQKQALQHQGAQESLQKLVLIDGPFGAKARQAEIREQLRERDYAAAAAGLQSHLTRISTDATLSPADAAEQAQWTGTVIGWMSGPAGIDADKFDAAAAHQPIRAAVSAELLPYFDSGLARVTALRARLQADRAELIDEEEAALQQRKADAAQEQQQLQAQQGTLTQSQEQTLAAAELELAKLDEQLAELENQYTELSQREQTLTSQCTFLQVQITTMQAMALNRNRAPGRSPNLNEALALNEKLRFTAQQRDEVVAQANSVAQKGQRLSQSRQALLAEYQQRTGTALAQSARLSQWQTRAKQQAERLGRETADRAKSVQRLDKKLRDLATYDRFDAGEEAQRTLARYRPVD